LVWLSVGNFQVGGGGTTADGSAPGGHSDDDCGALGGKVRRHKRGPSFHDQPHHRLRQVEPSRFAAFESGIANSAKFCLRRRSLKTPTSLNLVLLLPNSGVQYLPHFASTSDPSTNGGRNQVSPHHPASGPGAVATDQPTSHHYAPRRAALDSIKAWRRNQNRGQISRDVSWQVASC
jgi:hypothetical protein